jgi:hypothetical protein
MIFTIIFASLANNLVQTGGYSLSKDFAYSSAPHERMKAGTSSEIF